MVRCVLVMRLVSRFLFKKKLKANQLNTHALTRIALEKRENQEEKKLKKNK